MRWAEEVRANDAVSGMGLLADEGDVDGGCVAGQNRVRAAHGLQVGEDALLKRNVLRCSKPPFKTLFTKYLHDNLNMMHAL